MCQQPPCRLSLRQHHSRDFRSGLPKTSMHSHPLPSWVSRCWQSELASLWLKGSLQRVCAGSRDPFRFIVPLDEVKMWRTLSHSTPPAHCEIFVLLVDSEKIQKLFKLMFSGSGCLGKPWLTGNGWLAGSGDFARAFKNVCNGVVRWHRCLALGPQVRDSDQTKYDSVDHWRAVLLFLCVF